MTGIDHADLLAKYDEQLQTDALSAIAVTLLGPVHLVTFPWERGWITYRDFDGAEAATIRRWVGEVLDHFRSEPAVREVKWKARVGARSRSTSPSRRGRAATHQRRARRSSHVVDAA